MTQSEFQKGVARIADEMSDLLNKAVETCPELTAVDNAGTTLSIFVHSGGYGHADVYQDMNLGHGIKNTHSVFLMCRLNDAWWLNNDDGLPVLEVNSHEHC